MTVRQLGDILGVFDFVIVTPVVLFVAWRLWRESRKKRYLAVLRERSWSQRKDAIIVGVFSFIFWSNDMKIPLIDPDWTRVITRGIFPLALVSALYWLWLYRPKNWRRLPWRKN